MAGQSVSSEQGHSLAARMREQEIAHGDVVEDVVFEGVGVKAGYGMPHLACCPMKIKSIGRVHRASKEERAKPMPVEIHFSQASRRELQELHDQRGFATLHCKRVWSNGRINLEGVTVVKFVRVDDGVTVSGTHSYDEYMACA